ncbi:HAD family hydrolase [Desulfovibrio sp. TomC]|uniref:HAD family hydrolase n=1 Tax=Desulfovibrio sp. TomC TaxID=1562888 RepID=UPI000575CB7D|nr:HAD-IA family hydrolase [Desulfovibrio sp. TomC]KHK01428.1 hypothetical protein NY78_3182 [Desulfovibrio sp. TomC]
MQKPLFDAAVFDFDGTLAELVLDFTAMKAQVGRVAAGFLPDVPTPNGLPALEYVRFLAEAIGRDSPQAAARFELFAARAIMDQEIEAARAARLFDATRPALAALARSGIKIGIITRNCRAAVDIVFPDAADFAGVILARDDARHVKPDPRHLLDALACLDVPPARALMVGDHPMDVATGKAAGVRTAALASGRIPLAELARHDPDYLADDVAALVVLLA